VKLSAKVSVFAELTINDQEAEVLHLLTSYDLLKWFAEICNGRFKADELRGTLQAIHQNTGRVINARQAAIASVTGKGVAE
jgi:hypothetical protein